MLSRKLIEHQVVESSNSIEFSFFDFEVFPDFWLVKFYKDSTGMITITSDDTDWRESLFEQVKGVILVGYNIKGYDLRVLNALLFGVYTPQQVYGLSLDIIEGDDNREVKNEFNNYKYWGKFLFLDLFDDMMGSLKTFESNVGMDIRETTVPFNKIDLTKDEKLEIGEYCEADVRATVKLFDFRKDYTQGKITIGNMFNLDLGDIMKSTNAKLVTKVLNPTKIEFENEYFVIPENVKDYLEKYVPRTVLEYYTNRPMCEVDKQSISLFDNDIVLGLGGIHSTISDNVSITSNDIEQLYNIDVDSYYPNMMIHYNYLSRRVVEDRGLYETIYNKKFELSEIRDQYEKGSEEYMMYNSQRDATKLILNTTYGAMKNQYNAIFDADNASRICILGQLLLLALANELYLKFNCKIIQTNTDGILTLINPEDKEAMENIVSQWENRTMLRMDWDKVRHITQKNVNNYYIEFDNGKSKLKGKWANQAFGVTGSANLNAPIVHKAIVDYYSKDIPVENTIRDCKDILQFCFTSKTGYSYERTLYYTGDYVLGYKEEEIHKVNRTIATTDKRFGTIKKFKINKKGKPQYDKASEISEHSKILNEDISTYNFEDLDIDYEFYIEFAKKRLFYPNFIHLEKNDLIS